MNVRIKYGLAPIDSIAVQCPSCKKWFNGREITDGDTFEYQFQLKYIDFICPVCGCIFGNDDEGINIEEFDDYAAVHKDCMRRKVVWE